MMEHIVVQMLGNNLCYNPFEGGQFDVLAKHGTFGISRGISDPLLLLFPQYYIIQLL